MIRTKKTLDQKIKARLERFLKTFPQNVSGKPRKEHSFG